MGERFHRSPMRDTRFGPSRGTTWHRAAAGRRQRWAIGRLRAGRAAVVVLFVTIVSGVLVGIAPPAVAAPTLPQQLTALPSGTSVGMNWLPPSDTGGSPIDLYQITATDTTSGGAVPWGTEFACGTCTSVIWPNLIAGHSYSFAVAARNSQLLLSSPAIVVTNVPAGPCSGAGVCVTADATTPGPSISLVAQGLSGWQTYIAGSTDLNRLLALHVQNWRTANQLTGLSDWSIASSQTPNVTFCCVHQYWQSDPKNWVYLPLTHGFLYARSPWDNWSLYDAWVANFLNSVKAANTLPAYWDLMNECDRYQTSSPTTTCYYHGWLYGKTPTLDLVEQELQHLYVDIRNWYAANNLGTPKFVMPSISGFMATSAGGTSLPMPLDQLLSWSDTVGLHWDAVSWHEIQYELAFDYMNDAIPTHAQQVRALIASHPSLSGMKLFVNENGSTSTAWHAGWEVGRIWGLEVGGFDQGTRTCWTDPDHPGQNECFDGSLDGLLSVDASGHETLPRSLWWVNCEYAQMQGAARIPTSTSDRSVRTLGGYHSDTNTIQLLLGRHTGQSPSPGPAPTTLRLTVPASLTSANVFVQRIPDSNTAAETSLPAATQVVPSASGNVLAITLPSVADNDAYMLTVTTAGTLSDACRSVA
jgi:hypothetical protein